jgi:hypothetical protein
MQVRSATIKGWPSGRPVVSRLSSILRQPLPLEALGKRLRVFRLRKAEYDEVAFIAAQGIRERRRR